MKNYTDYELLYFIKKSRKPKEFKSQCKYELMQRYNMMIHKYTNKIKKFKSVVYTKEDCFSDSWVALEDAIDYIEINKIDTEFKFGLIFKYYLQKLLSIYRNRIFTREMHIKQAEEFHIDTIVETSTEAILDSFHMNKPQKTIYEIDDNFEKEYFSCLSYMQRRIVKYRQKQMTLQQIAKKLKVSYALVNLRYNQAKELLKKNYFNYNGRLVFLEN